MELECSTCLDSFTSESEVLSTPCGHIFHSDCIHDWLDKGDLNCPQCTNPITDFALLRRIYLPFQKSDSAQPVIHIKEWHTSMTADKRNKIVQDL